MFLITCIFLPEIIINKAYGTLIYWFHNRLPDRLSVTWPEGDELLPNEIRPAGTPIGMFAYFSPKKVHFFCPTFPICKSLGNIKMQWEDLADPANSLGVIKILLIFDS